MSAPHDQLLRRICGKKETLSKAKELLNLARAKTAPGSGHDLGSSTIALPAICAYLASQRLGNNDVVEKVAQQASCLNPKVFNVALNTVRSALSSSPHKQTERLVSYRNLCQDHGLNEDALKWMREIEKELRTAGTLTDTGFSDDAVTCVIFYWTCAALHIRSVKSSAIIAEYGVGLRDFQDLRELLDKSLHDTQERIADFVTENRTSRSAQASPSKSSRSISKSPSKGASEDIPLKRKTSIAAFLPLTPVKKPRVASPTKLNRLPVGPSVATGSASGAVSASSSPTKTYGSAKLKRNTPSQTATETVAASPTKTAATPVKAVGERMSRLALVEAKTPSPAKTRRPASPVAGPSTPTPRRRGRPKRMPSPLPAEESDVEMDGPQVADEDVESSCDDESPPPPCRHRLPLFPDRLFYTYRDPRVAREWEICEEHMKMMVEQHGDPVRELGG